MAAPCSFRMQANQSLNSNLSLHAGQDFPARHLLPLAWRLKLLYMNLTRASWNSS